MTTQTRKRIANAYLFGIPFVVCAALEFTPWWISYPVVFLGILKWLNETIVITEKEKS
jgi:hypothetical protein